MLAALLANSATTVTITGSLEIAQLVMSTQVIDCTMDRTFAGMELSGGVDTGNDVEMDRELPLVRFEGRLRITVARTSTGPRHKLSRPPVRQRGPYVVR